MDELVQAKLLAITAGGVVRVEHIQTLWSGYGEILRVTLSEASVGSVILKSIALSNKAHHPQGWNTSLSHARKVKSYEVEMHWYRDWALRCSSLCRIPSCLGVISLGDKQILVLEDLDARGFSARKHTLTHKEISVCLSWLANFHATFLNEKPMGLWPIGSYWHLATRADEWAVMENETLKQAAHEIDRRLNQCQFQTLVHGDAKVENFCFSVDGNQVAAVDFQYVGGGCGMKDVAYFLGSCLSEQQCLQGQHLFLSEYFCALAEALPRLGKTVDFEMLRSEWLGLYAYAWTDYYRFLNGWMPTSKEVASYSEQLAQAVLMEINGQRA